MRTGRVFSVNKREHRFLCAYWVWRNIPLVGYGSAFQEGVCLQCIHPRLGFLSIFRNSRPTYFLAFGVFCLFLATVGLRTKNVLAHLNLIIIYLRMKGALSTCF